MTVFKYFRRAMISTLQLLVAIEIILLVVVGTSQLLNPAVLSLLIPKISAVAGTLDISGGAGSFTGNNDSAAFRDVSNTAYFLDPAATGTSLVVAGNVGIGTIPAQKLSVAGTIESTTGGFKFPDGTTQTAAAAGMTSGMITAFNSACPTGWTEYTAARGRTVVGTPGSGTNAATVGTALTNSEDRTHTHTGPSHTHTGPSHQHGVPIGYDSGGYPDIVAGGPFGYTSYSFTTGSSRLGDQGFAGSSIFLSQAGGTGNTGAGGTGATGTAATSGVMPYIQLTYCSKNAGADLAEWIPSSENVSAATIVSTDPKNDQKLIASQRSYDPTVVGIVSTQPGWLIGDQKQDSVQMALSGRVPVRVTLKNGAIKRGDAITTSTIPGVGMRSTEPGAIIGKAMEELTSLSPLFSCQDPTKGTTERCGTITVLLTVGWYDPDAYLTDPGVFTLNGTTVSRITGEITQRIGAYANLIVGHLRAGLIETQKLIVDGMDIVKKLNELTATAAEQQKQIDVLKNEIDALTK